MQNHHSVIMVMYDLPVSSSEYRKKAHKFRNELKRMDYQCLQESVYVKIIYSFRSIRAEIEELKKKAPAKGDIRVLSMSLNGFRSIETISGRVFRMDYFSDDIVII